MKEYVSGILWKEFRLVLDVVGIVLFLVRLLWLTRRYLLGCHFGRTRGKNYPHTKIQASYDVLYNAVGKRKEARNEKKVKYVSTPPRILHFID
jgi:hypothetical protein